MNVNHELPHSHRPTPPANLPFAHLWTASRLKSQAHAQFGDSSVYVIANREPCIHMRKGGQIVTQFPASGLVTAVEPIIRACHGLWIAHGSGTADRETADEHGMLQVPPQTPEYSLKRVWLSKEEELGYYFGFANEGLWPLCHVAHTRPTFRSSDWHAYQAANEKFSNAFVEQAKHGDKAPVALIQDYHFALLPKMIRERLPASILSLFWHIPWPNPEIVRICPWIKEILQSMLAADLIGFQTQYHCNNFLDSADRFLEARVDRETFSVTIKGHTCYVKPFPISIEWPPKHDQDPELIPGDRQWVLDRLGLPESTYLAVGVDRLDYTKGIAEKFLAVEAMLDAHPELQGQFSLIQISAPSRTSIPRYRDLEGELREISNRINDKFTNHGVPPIIHLVEHHDSAEVYRFYRAADACLVTSLHDGMNLVAKEFVASRSDEGGALVLSRFTGAARELKSAYIVNPYNTDEVGGALYQAISDDVEERQMRMKQMRSWIRKNNVYAWAGNFLEEIYQIAERREYHEPAGLRPDWKLSAIRPS